MKILSNIFFSLLVSSMIFSSCHDEGPDPIDLPVHLDTIIIPGPPMDTMTPIDTTGMALINQLKGNYLGTCYYHAITSMEHFDTMYNQVIIIDSIERIFQFGHYDYVLFDHDGLYTFLIPESEFIQDTVATSAIGPSQSYQRTYQFIRSQGFLYSKSGIYPGFGFQEWRCYCYKQ